MLVKGATDVNMAKVGVGHYASNCRVFLKYYTMKPQQLLFNFKTVFIDEIMMMISIVDTSYRLCFIFWRLLGQSFSAGEGCGGSAANKDTKH